MRALLINPFYPIDETPSPPLGLAFLAAALEAAGIEVRILDYVVFPYHRDALAEAIHAFSPELIGATAVTMTVDHAMTVIRDAKAIAPSAVTVMGGPHVTFMARETLAACPGLDVVVRGEGEAVLTALAGSLFNRRQWTEIPGLVYRDGDRLIETAENPPGLDVNALPMPARHLLPLGRYRALNLCVSMTTSRGCPFQCIFCVGRRMVGTKVRYRDPIRVVDEFERLAGYGFHQINIADDLFTANARHATAICDEIRRRGIEVPWTAFARVDTVTLPVLRAMAAAGCRAVSFGIETGNPEILATIRKGITLKQVETAVGLCREAGLMPHGSFILGLPGESEDTLAETLAFGERLEAMGVAYGFHLLAPFPGTDVRDRAEAYGLRIMTDDWSAYHANRSVVDTGKVAPERLDAVAAGWKERFDAWLGDVARRMVTGEATDEEAGQLINLKRTVLVYRLMMERVIETLEEMPDAELAGLAARLAPDLGADAAELPDTLSHAAARGDLIARTTDTGGVRWHWRDTL